MKPICCALALLALGPSFGSNAQEGDPIQLEELSVTGIRLQQQRALDSKRLAETIKDVISSDELGQLPDKNAAEAVERLPGVSISIDQGEGRFVSIRGISPALNNLTINGVAAGSPEADGGGRPAPLDVIGGDLLQSIEVIKAQTPDMDAQGIGGTVNVVTASPFDYEEPLTAFGSARVGDQEFGGGTPYSANMTLVGTTGDERVGWLLGGSYSDRDFNSRGIFQDDWREETLGGVTASLPENAKNNVYQLERLRTAFNGALEFRPNDRDKYFLRAYYSQFEEDEVRQRYEHFFSRSITQLGASSGTSGDNNRREEDLRLEQKDKRFFNVSVGGENQLTPQWLLNYALQYNDNRQEEPNRNWEFRGNNYGPDSWTIDDGGIVALQGGPQDLLDPANLEFRRIRLQDNETDEDAFIASVDSRYDFQLDGKPSYVKFGGKFSTTERQNDASRIRYNLGSTDWFLSDFGHFGAAVTNRVDGRSLPNILIDTDAANAFFDGNRSNPEFFELDVEDTFGSEFASDYQVDEEIWAGYVMGSVQFDRLNVIAGVRVEHTQIESAGFRRDEATLQAVEVSGDGNYTSVLPSVVLRFDASDNLVLRASWTNSLGRPDYNQIAPISNLTRDGADGLLFIGNPDLEARESSNLDLSIEYYFDRIGIVSLAAFHKDIDNFIVRRTDIVNDLTFEGEFFERFITTTLENAQSAELTGVEFNFQRQLDFLPAPFDGFGINLSFAELDSDIRVDGRGEKLPLVLQPDWVRSYGLTYQKGPLQAALQLDEADAFLTDIGGSADVDLFAGEYGRLDFKASYTFSDNYTVFFEWQNINDEPTTEFQGNVERQNTQIETYGETIYLGMNLRF